MIITAKPKTGPRDDLVGLRVVWEGSAGLNWEGFVLETGMYGGSVTCFVNWDNNSSTTQILYDDPNIRYIV